MNVLVAEGLTKHYGRRIGLERLDLSVGEGSICGFLGPNGAGKTTAIRLFLGFLRPTRGRARILGHDCWSDGRRLRADVGYLPGDLRLYPWMTARRALALFGRIRRRDLLKPGLELAEEFGLDPGVRASSMSRGMRQKLGLILALAPRPRLLVLDEPTASLDPVLQAALERHLLEHAAHGSTVFFSSHVLGEVERICDRAVILRDGRAIADETIAGLRLRARREVTIEWADGAGLRVEPPARLELAERSERAWRGSISGSTAELVRWLAPQPIANVAIGHPDLETLFRRFYEESP